ncbi:MAG: hypothetical protein Q9180_003180, partial [Flavoplaca navasiana]
PRQELFFHRPHLFLRLFTSIPGATAPVTVIIMHIELSDTSRQRYTARLGTHFEL